MLKNNTRNKIVQLSLFDPVVLESERLKAITSPLKACYHIWLVREFGRFIVKKESGGRGKKLDARCWQFKTLQEAEMYFQRKIKEKTNPARKTRVYQRVFDV